MAVERRVIRNTGRVVPRTRPQVEEEPAIGKLVRELSDDATRLVRQEIELGKAELRESATGLARDGAKIAVAAAIGLLAIVAGTAFLILGLGDLIDNDWLAALIVTLLYAVAAALVGMSAARGLKSRDLKPTKTIETLRDDAAWAKREVQDAKRELNA